MKEDEPERISEADLRAVPRFARLPVSAVVRCDEDFFKPFKIDLDKDPLGVVTQVKSGAYSVEEVEKSFDERLFYSVHRLGLLPSAEVDGVVGELLASAKVAFFCEAKRGRRWASKKEWGEFEARFQNDLPGGVSNVFRQLYLKQRLSQGLVSGADLGNGVEFDGVLRTTRGDRRRKIGKNKVVLKAVDILKRYTGSAYFLILTPETWRNETTALFQTIQSFGPPPCDPRPRGWDISRWGVISLQDVVQLCNDRHLDHAAAVAEFNEGQLY